VVEVGGGSNDLDVEGQDTEDVLVGLLHSTECRLFQREKRRVGMGGADRFSLVGGTRRLAEGTSDPPENGSRPGRIIIEKVHVGIAAGGPTPKRTLTLFIDSDCLPG
jgi:hypothetical protein